MFFTVTLPLARPAVIAGAVLGFARALGEFGATIMIAGSIPGSTRTLAVAIYSFAETGRDREAGVLVAVSATIAFIALAISNWITSRRAPARDRPGFPPLAGLLYAGYQRAAGPAGHGAVRPVGRGQDDRARRHRRTAHPASGSIAIDERVLFDSAAGSMWRRTSGTSGTSRRTSRCFRT